MEKQSEQEKKWPCCHCQVDLNFKQYLGNYCNYCRKWWCKDCNDKTTKLTSPGGGTLHFCSLKCEDTAFEEQEINY